MNASIATQVILGMLLFTAIILVLVFIILGARSRLVASGKVKVIVNDERELQLPVGGKRSVIQRFDAIGFEPRLRVVLRIEPVFLHQRCVSLGITGFNGFRHDHADWVLRSRRESADCQKPGKGKRRARLPKASVVIANYLYKMKAQVLS